jgi:hypothetical protein
MSAVEARTVSRSALGSVEASTGSPASRAAAIARALLPVSSSTDAGGPTKVIPACSQASASSGVLRQEPVAGVDRVGPGPLRRADDLVDREVGADRVPLLADLVALVGLEPVDRVAVLPGEDGDRLRAELVGARKARTAISPRLATSTLVNTALLRGRDDPMSLPDGAGARGGPTTVRPDRCGARSSGTGLHS